MTDIQHAHNTDKQQPAKKNESQSALDIEAPQIASADILRQMAASPPDGNGDAPPLSRGAVQMLQRTAGNRYTNQLVQRKRNAPPVVDGFIGSFVQPTSSTTIQRSPASPTEQDDTVPPTEEQLQAFADKELESDNDHEQQHDSPMMADFVGDSAIPSHNIQRIKKDAQNAGDAAWGGMKKGGNAAWGGMKKGGEKAWGGMKKGGEKAWGGIEKGGKEVLDVNDKEVGDMSGDSDAEKYASYGAYKVGIATMDTLAGPAIGLAWNTDNLMEQWDNYACMYGGGTMGKIATWVARSGLIVNQLASFAGWIALMAAIAAGLGYAPALPVAIGAGKVSGILTLLYVGLKGYLVLHNLWRVASAAVKGEYNSDAMGVLLGDALDGGLAYGSTKIKTDRMGQGTAAGAATQAGMESGVNSGQELTRWGGEEAGNAAGQPISAEDPCDTEKLVSKETSLSDAADTHIQKQLDPAQSDELITGLDERIAHVKTGQEKAKSRLQEGATKNEQAQSAGQNAVSKLTGLLDMPKQVLGMFSKFMGMFKGKPKLPSLKKLGKAKKLFKSFKKLFKKVKRPPKLIQRSPVQHTIQPSSTPHIQRVFKSAWKWIKKQIKKIINKVLSVFKKIIRAIKKVIKKAIRVVKTVAQKIKGALTMVKSLMAKIAGRKQKQQLNQAKSDQYEQASSEMIKKMEDKKQKITEEKDKKAS